MAEISIVTAFLQAAEMLVAGDDRKAIEATRLIVDNLEKSKNKNITSSTINLSRSDKKLFSF